VLDLLDHSKSLSFSSDLDIPFKSDQPLIQWSPSGESVVLQSHAIPFFIWNMEKKNKVEFKTSSLCPFLDFMKLKENQIQIPILIKEHPDARNDITKMGFWNFDQTSAHADLTWSDDEKVNASLQVLEQLNLNSDWSVSIQVGDKKVQQ
jgi:hypothetical protein